MTIWKKKKKKKTFEKNDSKKNPMYRKGKWMGSSHVQKYANALMVYFIKQYATFFVFFLEFFSLEWYLAHSFFNLKKWPLLLKSCESWSLFDFFWWFFGDIMLVMIENRAVIMLLDMRVLFGIFLVEMSF
jgi:hypothetical protein